MGFLALILVLAIAHVNGEGACSVKCSADTEEACDKLSNCRWSPAYSGTCDYPDEDPCALTGSTCPAGCEYIPSRSTCSGRSDSECAAYTQAECFSHGCDWNPGEVGCFDWSYTCNDLSEQDCTEDYGCVYQPIINDTGSCRNDDLSPCNSLPEELCDNYPECFWEPPQSECYMESPNCERITDEPTCNTTNLCEWSDGYKECVNDVYCRSLPPSRCADGLNCQMIPDHYWCVSDDDNDNCVPDETGLNCGEGSDPGCRYQVDVKAHCDTKQNCHGNAENTACEENSAVGCVWKERDSGYCSFTGDASCSTNEANNACTSEAVNAGCKWGPTRPGFCNRKGCSNNNGDTDCTTESLASGCTWTVRTGYCKPLRDHDLCYDNAEKTGCDSASEKLCRWTTNPQCIADKRLKCYNNSDNNDCTIGSANAGCVWQQEPAFCVWKEGYQCYDNTGKTACDSTSDDRCVWYPGTEASCEANWDASCSSNEDKTDCSDVSKAQGCEWNPDTGSIVNVPVSIMFFVLIAFALL